MPLPVFALRKPGSNERTEPDKPGVEMRKPRAGPHQAAKGQQRAAVLA